MWAFRLRVVGGVVWLCSVAAIRRIPETFQQACRDYREADGGVLGGSRALPAPRHRPRVVLHRVTGRRKGAARSRGPSPGLYNLR